MPGYAITGNAIPDRLLDALRRASTWWWALTAVLVGAAVVLALAPSGPRTAFVGHATGLLVELFAGLLRLLHVGRTRRR